MKKYAGRFEIKINDWFEPKPWKVFNRYNGFYLSFGWLWLGVFITVWGKRDY